MHIFFEAVGWTVTAIFLLIALGGPVGLFDWINDKAWASTIRDEIEARRRREHAEGFPVDKGVSYMSADHPGPAHQNER